ncbi:hypothetical protein [Litoribacillus peritrichatus]|uniref:Uncharacterized protein n=1 Tax=Litoribacillus peritrichatus TaxID=718191 RepID=A0ABP7MV96_9GAMM
MNDVTITLINFDQKLILSKSDYQVVEQDEGDIQLLYKGETLCAPYLYFRPLNISEQRSQYDFEMLLFECYEDFLEPLEQTVEENSDHLIVRSRFALRQEDRETLTGFEFIYPDDEGEYRYQIENSIVPYEDPRISTNPLALTPEGHLVAERVEVPLVGSFLCPTSAD